VSRPLRWVARSAASPRRDPTPARRRAPLPPLLDWGLDRRAGVVFGDDPWQPPCAGSAGSKHWPASGGGPLCLGRVPGSIGPATRRWSAGPPVPGVPPGRAAARRATPSAERGGWATRLVPNSRSLCPPGSAMLPAFIAGSRAAPALSPPPGELPTAGIPWETGLSRGAAPARFDRPAARPEVGPGHHCDLDPRPAGGGCLSTPTAICARGAGGTSAWIPGLATAYPPPNSPRRSSRAHSV
jgi:hypothetical protein